MLPTKILFGMSIPNFGIWFKKADLLWSSVESPINPSTDEVYKTETPDRNLKIKYDFKSNAITIYYREEMHNVKLNVEDFKITRIWM